MAHQTGAGGHRERELTGTLQPVRTAKTSNTALIVLAIAVFAVFAAVVAGGLGW